MSDYDFFLVIPPTSGCYDEANFDLSRLDYYPRGVEDQNFASNLIPDSSASAAIGSASGRSQAQSSALGSTGADHRRAVTGAPLPPNINSTAASNATASIQTVTSELIQHKDIFHEAVRKFVETLHRCGLVVDTYQRSSKALTLYVVTKEQAEKLHRPDKEEAKRLLQHSDEKPKKTYHQPIQLMGYYPDIASILAGFDLGSCQLAYDPAAEGGGRCFATPRGKMTLQLRTNIVSVHDDRLDIFRLRKYFVRGIGVAVPSSCPAAHVNLQKVWTKRDQYLLGVLNAYRSARGGEYDRWGPDRKGMQRAGSPTREDDPKTAAFGFRPPEDLPELPEVQNEQLRAKVRLYRSTDEGLAIMLIGEPPAPIAMPAPAGAMARWQYQDEPDKSPEENARLRAEFEREFVGWHAAWVRRREAKARAQEEYTVQRVPIIAENLQPALDLEGITKVRRIFLARDPRRARNFVSIFRATIFLLESFFFAARRGCERILCTDRDDESKSPRDSLGIEHPSISLPPSPLSPTTGSTSRRPPFWKGW